MERLCSLAVADIVARRTRSFVHSVKAGLAIEEDSPDAPSYAMTMPEAGQGELTP